MVDEYRLAHKIAPFIGNVVIDIIGGKVTKAVARALVRPYFEIIGAFESTKHEIGFERLMKNVKIMDEKLDYWVDMEEPKAILYSIQHWIEGQLMENY